MERAGRAPLPGSASPTIAFRDGLGERRQILDPTGTETLEFLCLRPELAAVPSFEFALRERVSRLANFRHDHYARVRAVERLSDGGATLAVVSESTPGVRLSDMLAHAEERKLSLDINTALCLIHQLVPAVEALHESARDVAHGALGPERLIVTPHARVMITEYVIGAALEQLRYPQDRYWTELRVAVPRSGGPARFDQRADVTQLGIIALSLILGRPLRDDEFPARIAEVVASTWAVSARGGFEPLPPGLRGWLGRALQVDPKDAFASAVDARVELDKVVGDSDHVASTASLEAFLARHYAVEKMAGATGLTPPAGLQRPASFAPPAPAPASPAHRTVATPTPAAGTMRPSNLTSPAEPAGIVRPSSLASAPTPAAGTARPQPSTPAPPLFQKTYAAPAPPKAYEPDPVLEADDDHSSSRLPRLALIAAVLIALVGGGAFAGRRFFAAKPNAVATTGTLVITTNPPGAEAFVNGESKGVTPVTLTLTPGQHSVELRNGGEPRLIPVTITAGTQVAQYVDLPATSSANTGQLSVRTEPAGAQVTIDGVPRGTTPALVGNLAPGEHIVNLESDLGSVKQVVMIESGVTASLVVPLAAPVNAPLSGWISVSSPIDVQLWEQGRLIGTNQSDRVMVSAGRHDIEMVNNDLGYRATRTVQVPAGKTAAITVEVPKGTISVNAVPWAEVWIDGEKVGDTPIGNLTLTIGRHSVTFRHPELGEQHHTATVTLKDVTRLSVDLRKR